MTSLPAARGEPFEPDYAPQAGGIAARARASAPGGAVPYLAALNPEQREAV
ncbi:MAG: hypothetical protein JO141_01810, partial [Bradyrhizobium sp.]|nr:hypothetical protein [Bradyrhizobium sp.]